MKVQTKILLFPVMLLFFSCSKSNNDDTNIGFDSSVITSYTWELTAFKTSQPIDLNRDGITSTDMVFEYDCMKTEQLSFYYTTEFKQEFIDNPGKFSMSGNTSGNIINIECLDESDIRNSLMGTLKMLNQNSCELTYKSTFLSDPIAPFKRNFTLIDNKLIGITEESFPTTFNTVTNQWEENVVTITREFSIVNN